METTGRTLTRHKCYIGFYDFSGLSPVIGWIVKILSLSQVTHVGPIIELQSTGEMMAITLRYGDAYWTTNDVLLSMGARLVHKEYVGELELDLDEILIESRIYMDTTVWDAVFHILIGQFIGLTRPRVCTTHVCRLFKLKEAWYPCSLYRRYK